MNYEFIKAKKEIGNEEFNQRFRKVLGNNCLDYVETIVINLPNSCYANCPYCIDKSIKHKTVDEENFIEKCCIVFNEFKTMPNIAITGGTMSSTNFNRLLNIIRDHYPSAFINWNTNGIKINHSYDEGIRLIDVVNLHRNHYLDDINEKKFYTSKHVLTLEEAKDIFKNKLWLRVTVEHDFNFDKYIDLKLPLYLNRLLPGTKKSKAKFSEVLDRLNIVNNDVKRRNVYINADYEGVPIRICVGDTLSKHISGRKPTFLNVVVVHRNGIVSGSWYEDDKFLA